MSIPKINIDIDDIIQYNKCMEMELSQQTVIPDRMEVNMGSLVSRVPELLSERGWGALDLIRRGVPYNTAYRIARGETDFTLRIARQICEVFELNSLDEVFQYVPDSKEKAGA